MGKKSTVAAMVLPCVCGLERCASCRLPFSRSTLQVCVCLGVFFTHWLLLGVTPV